MKKLILAILSIFLTAAAANAITAAEVMKKAAGTASSAKGISGTFSISSGGRSFAGTLKASGSKFSIVTGSSSSWYNGKYLWTYNGSSKETTLVTPTATELTECNPLAYLNSYSRNYTPSFSKVKSKGGYVVILTAKSKHNSIKTVEISVDSRTWKPSRFLITASNGTKTTVSVKSLIYGARISSSDFEYPKSKYPKVPVIDLR